MDRRLHSFTLTIEASDYVRRMKKGAKSYNVSLAICKYAEDYKLSPDGVRYWQELRDIEASLKKEAWDRIKILEDTVTMLINANENLNNVGVKHHFVGFWKALFRLGR